MPNIYFEILDRNICSIAKKPTPAYMAVPDWWKNMEKYNYEIENAPPYKFPHSMFGTARNCPAMNDAFNFGYMLYVPTDIYIDTTDESQIKYYVPLLENYSLSSIDEYIGFHDNQQFPGFKNDPDYNNYVFKINPFFGISTDPGYSVWITHPIGREDLPFRIVDAIVDTDAYSSIFPYSFFVKKKFCGVIKSGTPLLQVIPFKREDFTSKIIEKNEEKIQFNSSTIKSHFTNGYKKNFWSRKRFF